MGTVDVGLLIANLRAAGVDLSVEDGRIRCRTRDGRRPSLDAQALLEDVRGLGMVVVDFLQRVNSPAGPDDVAGDISVLPSAAPEDQRVINKGLDNPGGFDQIPAADGSVLPEPDADGVVRLVRVPPEVAFAAGELINDGKAELIGNVIYRRLSNVFDVTYRVFEP